MHEHDEFEGGFDAKLFLHLTRRTFFRNFAFIEMPARRKIPAGRIPIITRSPLLERQLAFRIKNHHRRTLFHTLDAIPLNYVCLNWASGPWRWGLIMVRKYSTMNIKTSQTLVYSPHGEKATGS